jgi:mono/diheme cytochrome c family protein
MPQRFLATAFVVLAITITARAVQRPPASGAPPNLERRFTETVRPFLESYCVSCHGGATPAAQLDFRKFASIGDVVADYPHWALVLDKLREGQMPPPQARNQPTAADRQQVIDWVESVRRGEAKRNAGDPGIVLARRLSNAEYNNTIRDLTGVDLRPAREFPVDPANPAGFDNSGESLAMSPALLAKYLQAAREVANNLVLKPGGIAFAAHPMLVETDRDKYCVQQIIDFYNRYSVDLADYFEAAYRTKSGKPVASPKLSPKYVATVLRTLEGPKEELGPLAKLQAMWQERRPAGELRDYVTAVRKKIAFTYVPIKVKGISETAQPFLMWRNRQYATNRTGFNRAALQPDAPDAELVVPAAERARYEAAFARFAAVFPDAFYVSERGRYFPDNTRDQGRHLSAGFHNVMGYFRDDRPFYELMLDQKAQRELDGLWDDLDFVALGLTRTFVQFFLNESGEARGLRKEAEGPRPADKDIASAAVVNEVADAYRNRVRQANDVVASRAIDEHFAWVSERLAWVERTRAAAEPKHLDALLAFAARAYRRPLTPAERADLVAYYKSLRNTGGLDHADAMRDAIVSVLMAPDFCYRLDLLGDSQRNIAPLSDHALASRLSYFLWASMPDAELLRHADAGDLDRADVLVAQARRLLQDPRVRGLATEFGGNWLDFRRFEEHNAVDRERFPAFDNALRQAMFEEPVQFMLDVFRGNGSVLDFLYANHTFVNPVLAKHYGMPDLAGQSDHWVRVDDAQKHGRGGLLPMAVFLTKNAPGLRTSPVKRGYWVVKQLLGEHIPPPPAAVPELPRDEANMELPLRDMLARHRQDKMCASCHARFDSLGLVFEGYGPVGERRSADLSGRAVDVSATFPGGTTGAGLDGLRAYLRAHRQNDFVDALSRKLLAYALGRSLILSDDLLIDAMRARLVKENHRFDSLIETIVSSKQFLTKRSTS